MTCHQLLSLPLEMKKKTKVLTVCVNVPERNTGEAEELQLS